jgi:flavodoxin
VTAFVVYDTAYGNTARVAKAFAAGLGVATVCRTLEEVDPKSLSNGDLLVVGSPTQGGRPTAAMQVWMTQIPKSVVEGTTVATFDTRLDESDKSFLLGRLIEFIGRAAPRMMRALCDKGAIAISEPQGFKVTGKEGPLASGELARATMWGRTLATAAAALGPAHY